MNKGKYYIAEEPARKLYHDQKSHRLCHRPDTIEIKPFSQLTQRIFWQNGHKSFF